MPLKYWWDPHYRTYVTWVVPGLAQCKLPHPFSVLTQDNCHQSKASLYLCVHQQASCKNHRVNRVVFLGNMKRLLTTGVSRWNTRQIALWDQVRRHLHMARVCNARVGGASVCLIPRVCCSSQEDLSMPIVEEDIDGLSGLLFPFYDADTHMLYLAGKVSTLTVSQQGNDLPHSHPHLTPYFSTMKYRTLRLSFLWIIRKLIRKMH